LTNYNIGPGQKVADKAGYCKLDVSGGESKLIYVLACMYIHGYATQIARKW
jgi:hypothetical protein